MAYNRGRVEGLADGIVITPSHNPPDSGGFKYDPPSGGPAETQVTRSIEARANALLADGLRDVVRVPYERVRRAATMHPFDYLDSYVGALGAVIDMDVLRGTHLTLGVDPLGGASVGYWEAIGERYGFRLEVVNPEVDPTFRFMTVDWDGKIRMDPSSPYAMARLIGLRDRFDLAFATDPDADRHGIVTRSAGLMNPNHYLTAAIWHLFRYRPGWPETAAVGKTIVSSSMIDRVAARIGRPPGRGPRRLQVLRGGAPRRFSRLRRRGERRRLVPGSGRHGVGHGQGWLDHEPPRCGDHGQDGPRSRRALP